MSKYKKTKASQEKFKRTTVKNEIGYENSVPVWMFDKIDRNGKFAFDLKRKDFEYCEFLDKMIAYITIKMDLTRYGILSIIQLVWKKNASFEKIQKHF